MKFRSCIFKPFPGSCQVRHKLLARSVEPFWRLLNKQTDKPTIIFMGFRTSLTHAQYNKVNHNFVLENKLKAKWLPLIISWFELTLELPRILIYWLNSNNFVFSSPDKSINQYTKKSVFIYQSSDIKNINLPIYQFINLLLIKL